LSRYIDEDYYKFLESLPSIYFDPEEDPEDLVLEASEDFNFRFYEYDNKGDISSFPKISYGYEKFIDYILDFWKKTCNKYFYNEVALIDCSEFWDELSIFYVHKGKEETMEPPIETGFILSFTELAIERYNEPFDLNINGIDKEELTKEIEKEIEKEEYWKWKKSQLEKLEKISEEEFEEIKKDALITIKKVIEEGKSIKHILLLGSGYSGKTTLILKYLTNKFSSTNPPFLMDCFLKKIKYQGKDYYFVFWDISFIIHNYFLFLLEYFINKADGILAINDLTIPSSMNWFGVHASLFQKYISRLPMIFIFTKYDLKQEIYINDDLLSKVAQQFSEETRFFKISSVTGENINEAFEYLIEKVITNSTKKDKTRHKKLISLYEYIKSFDLLSMKEIIMKEFRIKDEKEFKELSRDRLLFLPEFAERIKNFLKNLDPNFIIE